MAIPDFVDEACKNEQEERERLIKAHAERPRETPLIIKGVRLCVDCHEPIDKQRIQAVTDCVRCFECQHFYDKKRGFR